MSMEMELLLDDLTKPEELSMDWEKVRKFARLIKREGDTGANDAVQMLLDKIRSKNSTIALKAMTVLEGCVKHCGPSIHGVVGKFRFLNEFIKMVSPKYYSDTPADVKKRVLATMQLWNYNLIEQSKVREAYQMLVRQGVQFPEIQLPKLDIEHGEAYLDVNPNSMTKRVSPLEEDAKKAKLLEKLLKSKDPNDLMKANKLIKKMADQHAKKGEKLAETRRELEVVKNNVKLLQDMLQHYSPQQDIPLEKNEVVQDLHKTCTEMRAKVFKIASNLEEGSEVLGESLAVNDDLTRVLDLYDSIKAQQPVQPQGGVAQPTTSNPVPQATSAPAPAADSLLDLNFDTTAPPPAKRDDSLEMAFGGLGLGGDVPMSTGPPAGAPAPAPAPQNDLLGLLGGPSSAPAPVPVQAGGLDVLGMSAAPAPAPPNFDTLFINLNTIQLGPIAPVTVYEKNGLKIYFQFASNSPHKTVPVVIANFLNTGMTPIANLSFQVAVPKALQVKLQPASGNSMQPNETVKQVMLLNNPTQIPIKVRFKLDFAVNGQAISEMGESGTFPL
eukprot:m.43705 g.43705  ORF g.43705 m.43705 type:complete len:554 (+) comp9998_c0_seq2:180-1841(+)